MSRVTQVIGVVVWVMSAVQLISVIILMRRVELGIQTREEMNVRLDKRLDEETKLLADIVAQQQYLDTLLERVHQVRHAQSNGNQ